MIYTASVKNKETKKIEVITSDYPNKKAFAFDLRRNGYSVRFISTEKNFDRDCEKYYEKLESKRVSRQTAKETELPQQSNTYTDYDGNVCELKEETIEIFNKIVDKIKSILGCDTPIYNADLEYLPENKTSCVLGVNFGGECIAIDNFQVHMMELGDIYINETIHTICHEIAHNTYYNHGKAHSDLTEEYFNLVMNVFKQHTTETTEEPEHKMGDSTFNTVIRNAKNLPRCDFPNDTKILEICKEMNSNQLSEFCKILFEKGVCEYWYGQIVTSKRHLLISPAPDMPGGA